MLIELERSIATWTAKQPTGPHIHMVVLPPRSARTMAKFRNVGHSLVRTCTADDAIVSKQSMVWTESVSNSNEGAKTLTCVADFHLTLRQDAAAIRSLLEDVALTSANLVYHKPVAVVVTEQPWGFPLKLCAYLFYVRDPFVFITDMAVRGKLAISGVGAAETEGTVASPFPINLGADQCRCFQSLPDPEEFASAVSKATTTQENLTAELTGSVS